MALALQLSSTVRGARRYEYRAECHVDLEGIGRAALECANVSAAGVFLRTAVLPDEGTRVRCAIPLPDRGHWLVGGHVIRVELGADPGIAVAFDGVSAFDRQRLVAAFV